LDLSPGISYFFGQLGKAFFALGSHASLLSLAAAFLIAVAFLTSAATARAGVFA
jgi:hypothetical protein